MQILASSESFNIPNYYYVNDILISKRNTAYMKDGMLGEAPVTNACCLLNIPCDHNPYNEKYADNSSFNETKRLDHVITRDYPDDRTRLIIVIECKNHEYGSSWWTKDWIDDEIISRYENDKRIDELYSEAKDNGWTVTVHKYLFCSFFNGSQKMRKYLEEDRWKIHEFGYKVSISNFGKAVNFCYLKLFWLKDLFKQYFITTVTNERKPVYRYYSYREFIDCCFGRFDSKQGNTRLKHDNSNRFITDYG